MCVNREEAVVVLVEVRKTVEVWCLGQLAVDAVRPAMVFARKYFGVAAIVVK